MLETTGEEALLGFFNFCYGFGMLVSTGPALVQTSELVEQESETLGVQCWASFCDGQSESAGCLAKHVLIYVVKVLSKVHLSETRCV